MSLVFEDDELCKKCEQPKPDEGWINVPSWKDSWLGKRLDDRYIVVQQLGSGVTSAVYRIVLEHLNREFAAKILTDKKVIESPRWQREARSLAKLRNPHVVRIVEVIEEAHSVVLITEYIDGTTIEDIVERSQGGIPVNRALELVRQIANGIHEAHARDIIHRDLKPANIIVQTLPAIGDFAKILDFGLAKNQSENSSETQGFIGTPDFASPEQIANEPLSAKSDIYSLGGLLFYMLTGQAPFQEPSVMRVLQAHLWGVVPQLGDIRDDLKKLSEVNDLIQKMMAKSPHDRPESAAKVCEMIAHLHLEGEALGAEQTSILGTASEIIESPSLFSVTSSGEIISAKTNSFKIVSRSDDGEQTFTEVNIPSGEVSAIYGKSDSILVGTTDGKIIFMDRENQTFRTVFEDPRRSPIDGIAANPQKVVIASSDSGRLYASVDADDFRRIPNDLQVHCVAVAFEEPIICAASDGKVVVYEINNLGKWKVTKSWPIDKPHDIAISPDGESVAILDFSGGSSLYSRKTGQLLKAFSSDTGHPIGIAFSPDSDLISVDSNGENVTIVNVNSDTVD